MSLSSISVVIPTYNRGHLVSEAVASVLAQTVPPLEVIVVDDGSTDNTRDRLRPYMPQIIYRYQENQGVSAARNLGICEARVNSSRFSIRMMSGIPENWNFNWKSVRNGLTWA